MTSMLGHVFRHNTWATLTLIDFCAGLAPEQLEASAPGTYGQVRETLNHLVSSERYILSQLWGKAVDAGWPRGSEPSFVEVRTAAEWSGAQLEAAAEMVDAEAPLTLKRGGRELADFAYTPLVQAINHGSEHRAHITTILSQNGVQAPDLDGWAYGAAMSAR